MVACHVYKTVVNSLADEGDEEAALVELLRSPVDALAVEVHSTLVEFDEVSFVASPDITAANEGRVDSSESNKLPSNWNKGSPNFFGFRYRVEIGNGADDLIDLTITKLGNSVLLVSALSENSGRQVSVKLDIKSYVNLAVFSRPDGSEVIQDIYISETKTDLLGEKLLKEVIGPLIGTVGIEEKRASVGSIGSNDSRSNIRGTSISGTNSGIGTTSRGTNPENQNQSQKRLSTSSTTSISANDPTDVVNKLRQSLIEEEIKEESQSAAESTPSTPPPFDPIRAGAAEYESGPTAQGFDTPNTGSDTAQPPLIPTANDPTGTSGPGFGGTPIASRADEPPIQVDAPPGFEDEYEIKQSMKRRTSRHDIAQPGYPTPYIPIGGDDIFPPGGRNPPLAPFVGPGMNSPSIGSGDLHTPSLPGFPGGSNHQGMHPTFDHPIFQGRRGSRQPGTDDDIPDSLTRPPGARWDPTGPPGQGGGFGFGPNRFI
ncbi:hypothetical protein AWJ20_846 [Sugiyamaella lignohabitans]|uniref:Uncharacterized protein n=1 Tax=Sugiyamaella lignohabitans TaxID=796027 RepID=A0A167D7V1_9ASCO|nr:uncharacterized protein AWJ20_846 [Sugiyamaella lignohabitans]ANB12589.1 hypothetical protein AWJ20_846 [Sugiyamaella lignohabitans]